MGFLSEIKKLLFVKQSVAKSAAEKTVEFGKERGGEVLSKSKDFMEDGVDFLGDKTSGLRDAVLDKSGDAFDTIKNSGGDAFDTLKDAGSGVFGSVKDKAGDVMDSLSENEMVQKAGDFTESVGEKVMDKGGDLFEKGKDIAGSVGGTVVEKAGEAKEFMSDKFDETLEKAQKFEAEEAAKPKREFAEDTIDTGESLLKDTDDFFSKADRFAGGEYGAMSEGKTKIMKDRIEIEPKAPVKAAGFLDADGDGDEIVDDAIIIHPDSEDHA